MQSKLHPDELVQTKGHDYSSLGDFLNDHWDLVVSHD